MNQKKKKICCIDFIGLLIVEMVINGLVLKAV